MGDKIGEGIGKTRKEAQHQAVMNALQNLASKLLPYRTTKIIRGILSFSAYVICVLYLNIVRLIASSVVY